VTRAVAAVSILGALLLMLAALYVPFAGDERDDHGHEV
jgi:hypothetical protein